jgi:hypothetical protein
MSGTPSKIMHRTFDANAAVKADDRFTTSYSQSFVHPKDQRVASQKETGNRLFKTSSSKDKQSNQRK